MTMDKTKNKIMIVAGGTGGHVFTGVAVAESILSRNDCEIVFVGTNRGLEAQVCNSLGWKLIIVKSAQLNGKKIVYKIWSLVKIFMSIFSSIRMVHSEKPSVLVSIGGYASGPVSVAARILRIPIILIEPNSVPGMANRMAGRFARLICIAFDCAAKYFDARKVVKTGIPVRNAVLNITRNKNDSGKLTIFIFGGSQGAKKINEAVLSAVKKIKDNLQNVSIIHQVGSCDDVMRFEMEYKKCGINASVFNFSDDIWKCYQNADFVISRAGAATVAELSAISMPSLLIPYPHASYDHQMSNAMEIARIGGAIVVEDGECDGDKIASIINEFIKDRSQIEVMSNSLRQSNVCDRDGTVAKKIMSMIGNKNV